MSEPILVIGNLPVAVETLPASPMLARKGTRR
jgi:hypothetical protein